VKIGEKQRFHISKPKKNHPRMEGRIESSKPPGHNSFIAKNCVVQRKQTYIDYLSTFGSATLSSPNSCKVIHGRIITETCLAILFAIHKPIFVCQNWENEPPAN